MTASSSSPRRTPPNGSSSAGVIEPVARSGLRAALDGQLAVDDDAAVGVDLDVRPS